jgi:hypothetical protein
MLMRFQYRQVKINRPSVALGGRLLRPRTLVTVAVLHSGAYDVLDALLDTGADDTVFPEDVAKHLGVDLTNAPTGEASGVGLAVTRIRFAPVKLRLSGGREFREWIALVGFAARLKQPLLGYAGCLQFFTATFYGDLQEVELTINGTYPGT